MDVKQFENNRWTREDQKIEFRHKAALSFVDYGNVLDLGSGDGLMLSLLKDKGIEGRGLDISDEGVGKANSRGLVTEVYDFGSKPLPFADNSFDSVLMLDILEHLYDPGSVMREAARVSKKHVIIGVPNFSSLPARLQMLVGKVPENNRPKKGHVYWFNIQVMASLARTEHLRIVDMRINTQAQKIPLIGFVFSILGKLFPNLFALSYVFVLEKTDESLD
jgi:methionine biosynthesis protein MetW